MDLVAGAIGNLGPKLLHLLRDEYKLQKNVRKKLQFLSEELESIHGALRTVAATPPEQLDEQVRIWARQVREASYDMEDVLDTFLLRVEGCRREPAAGQGSSWQRRMGRLFVMAKARRDISGAMDGIKERVREVAERRDRCKVVDEIVPSETSAAVDPRLEAMYREATQLVGVDGAVGELVSILSGRRDEASGDALRMVSVLGGGGLGKTTLAKAVYDKLRSQFSCGAFVSVGRNPDLKKVFRDILIDLDKHKYYTHVDISILGEKQLIDEIREFLQCKRYE